MSISSIKPRPQASNLQLNKAQRIFRFEAMKNNVTALPYPMKYWNSSTPKIIASPKFHSRQRQHQTSLEFLWYLIAKILSPSLLGTQTSRKLYMLICLAFNTFNTFNTKKSTQETIRKQRYNQHWAPSSSTLRGLKTRHYLKEWLRQDFHRSHRRYQKEPSYLHRFQARLAAFHQDRLQNQILQMIHKGRGRVSSLVTRQNDTDTEQ